MKKENRDDSLRRLVSACLIELEPDSRYSVLEPTHLFVNSLWREYPDLHQTFILRATKYYISLLKNASETQKWISVEEEKENIISIFNWLYDNDYFDIVIELAYPLSDLLNRLGLWDQRVNVCELATLAAANVRKTQHATNFTYDAAEIHKQF